MSDNKEYQRGYAAGRKRQQIDIDQEAKWAERDKRWNEAFIAALPACINVQGWTCGGQKITSLTARTKLAADFADEALKYMRTEPA